MSPHRDCTASLWLRCVAARPGLAGARGVLVEARLHRAPYPAGLALGEPGGHDLRHRVMPGLVLARHHRQRAVPVAVEWISGVGGEDVDAAAVQDLPDVLGERPEQPGVLAVGLEPADLAAELVIQPDEV